eukprot:scaffold33450_cov70-Phaeocystis_antarctica.AAC.2
MTFSHAVCIPLMPRPWRRSTTLLGLELGLGLGLGSGSGLSYLGLGLGAGARPSSSPGSSPGRGVSPPQRPWQEHQLAVRAPYQAYQQRHPARVADLRRAWSELRLGLGSGLGSGG